MRLVALVVDDNGTPDDPTDDNYWLPTRDHSVEEGHDQCITHDSDITDAFELKLVDVYKRQGSGRREPG